MTVAESKQTGFELGTDGPSVIVVGLDGSQLGGEGCQNSLHAAAYASGLARRQGSDLVAVWVRPKAAIVGTLSETAESIVEGRAETEADVRGSVEAAAEYYDIPSTSFEVREGDPFRELTAVADRVHADAIVVGASEHRLGSLAVRLVRDGRWPVTVVP